METTILGRGASLEKLKGFQTNSDLVITCNCFWENETTTKPFFQDNLISSFLNDKKIITVCSPLGFSNHNIKEFENNFNIIKKYNACFNSGNKRKLYPIRGFSCMPDSVLSLYNKIDNAKIKKQGDAIAGTLAYAVLLAISEYKSKKVNIFGLDFYEKNYYIPQTHDYSKEQSSPEVIQNKIDFCNFFNFLSNIHFNVYTLANFQCSNNVSVL